MQNLSKNYLRNMREMKTIPETYISTHIGFGGIVDVETTGLNWKKDEVIELAVILFAFEQDTLEIVGVVDEYVGFREPGRRIGTTASRIHGITWKMVKGQRLNNLRIEALIARAQFLIAHNAAFDRRFLEKIFPSSISKPWLCSMTGINWLRKGYTCRGLQFLLKEHGIKCPQAHRGESDAKASLALISIRGPNGKTYFRELVENSRSLRARLAVGRIDHGAHPSR